MERPSSGELLSPIPEKRISLRRIGRIGVLAQFLVCISVCISTLLLSCGSGSSSSSSSGSGTYPINAPWTLVWSDEFNGTDGSSPDAAKWTFDTGTGSSGWGNNELETYTSRTQNAQIQGGNLVITAAKETYTGSDGVTRNYTSARLKTEGLFSQQYGRFEARIKLPQGQGIWPAFWTLGNNIGSVGWPACGEVDIMENLGQDPTKIYGTLHGTQGSGSSSVGTSYVLPNGAKFSDDFHIFAIEWDPDVVRFYVDGTLYQTLTPSSMPSGATWPMDHPFFIVLNVAVGGDWPGAPDSTTVFPQTMLVDYVRVYARES